MEETLKIAVCEDTESEEETLLALLHKSEFPSDTTVFHSGEELLSVYRPQMFDLLLMDIYMGGVTGIETVAKIREVDEEVPVAFITTSRDHTLESYRLSALKYIEKPYREKDIEDILKLAQMEKENAPCLVVRKNGKEKRIRLAQILYLEASNRLLLIPLLGGETVQVYGKLSDVLPQLKGYSFFQSHKSCCVNLSQVQYIDENLRCFVMSNGENVPIRRDSMGKAKKVLEDFLFSRTRGLSH